MAEVREELAERVETLLQAGVEPGQLVLDPGLGFSKTGEHNWQVLAGLAQIAELGLPLLVGASRKRFLGTLMASADGEPAPPHQRDAATAATSALAAAAGVWCVRVHEVSSSVAAVRVAAAWTAAARKVST